MLRGFKEFIMKGNVIDLAAAVIIGAAFGAIVDSLVKDIVTPILTAIGGQPDFSAVRLGPLGVGNFLNAVIAFLIKAAGLYFLIVVPFNRVAARMAAAPPTPPSEAYLREIRDLLAQRR
ncbi:MAG TPA: large conductance mechanosensitive channel protein MscL [Thermoanaerobaculia bacterium]|nr:large conductance mechanosensitive channel protein MscL [Thermoanaerobaculia bacterium]